MAMEKAKTIWMNGTWVPWEDAKIHILSHVAHYASSVFEGIRAYETPQGPAIFRLPDHIDRLMLSAKIYRMDAPFTRDQILAACLEAVARNGLSECYIRPLIYRGYENLGVNPFNSPVEVAIAAYPWGKYLGEDALAKGVAVKVSSWQRMAPNTLPPMAKASANYMNAQLIKMEALIHGYAEGIALDASGYVSEGSGQNVFLVVRGEILTPALHNSILAGITRDTVMTLARELGYSVREMTVPRELLYAAEELFYSGTAVEVSPIVSVDKLPVGDGAPGPVTKAIQEAYFATVRGRNPKQVNWLSPVRSSPAPARAEAVTPAARRA
jgi:branched-chain amino acid aminotransferase